MCAFHFKQFTVKDEHSSMKVGTDAVILGAYADLSHKPLHILDIGCGSGILSLMLAQRSSARITAIELNVEACKDAYENFRISNWAFRLKCICSNIADWKSNEKFDLIISNPPYFTEDTQSHKEGRAMARSTGSLNYHQLILSCQKHLSQDGRAEIIIPYENQKTLIFEAGKYGLYTQKKLLIRDHEKAKYKRAVITLSKNPPASIHIDVLNIRAMNGTYSNEFIVLTKDFYLEHS